MIIQVCRNLVSSRIDVSQQGNRKSSLISTKSSFTKVEARLWSWTSTLCQVSHSSQGSNCSEYKRQQGSALASGPKKSGSVEDI